MHPDQLTLLVDMRQAELRGLAASGVRRRRTPHSRPSPGDPPHIRGDEDRRDAGAPRDGPPGAR
jgi:hypothetical protein